MKEIGIVKKNLQEKATVEIQRHAACGSCGACQLGSKRLAMEVIAENPIHASEGDTVMLDVQFANVFKATLIGYGLPFIMFMVGIYVGYLLNSTNNLNNELIPFFTGIAMIAITYLGIHFLDQRKMIHLNHKAKITRVVSEEDAQTLTLLEN